MNYFDFTDRLNTDKEFAKKFADIKDIAQLIKAAATEGYTFTKDDVKANTPVSGDDLDVVAGGGFIDVEPYNRSYISKA